ncbi:RDD family protein [Ktedonobacteria bacterium brp13]|nr:RDD family protein [Ktedonobacteria bacterium brp13]
MRNISTFAENTSDFDNQEIHVTPNVDVMGSRVVAAWLDFMPLSVLLWLVDTTFGINHYLSSLPTLSGIPYTSSLTIAVPGLYLLMIVYYTVQEALFGATFGKFIMGLRVVQNDGSPVTFIGALVRNVVRPIDATSGYLLGWLIALWSSRHRRLGDHLAGTLVVSKDSVLVAAQPRSYFWLRLGTLTFLCACLVTFCLGFDYYGRPPLVIQGLTNANAPSPIFTDRGTITDLTQHQTLAKDNTVTYAVTFTALNHGTRSQCQGNITLTWTGFPNGWSGASGETTCNPA